MSTEIRGIRNKNPLNLRIGNDWVGEVPEPTDPDFEQFTSMTYGLRAGFIVLRRYIVRYHRNTVPKIISSWSPRTENATKKYIKAVCEWTGFGRNQVLSFDDRDTMEALVSAMCRYETGCTIPRDVINHGYDLASGMK